MRGYSSAPPSLRLLRRSAGETRWVPPPALKAVTCVRTEMGVDGPLRDQREGGLVCCWGGSVPPLPSSPSNLIDVLSREGSAPTPAKRFRRRLFRRSGERSGAVELDRRAQREGSAPTPAKNSAAVYSEDLARRGTPEGESLPYSSLPYSHPF